MDESFLQNDDTVKSVKTRYPLFNGKIGTGETYEDEVAYYAKYPTIYHLRDRLIKDTSQADLRLVYLAIHHILKYRGHFVNQGQVFDLTKPIDVSESLSEVLVKFDENSAFDWRFDEEKFSDANEILTNRRTSKSKKAFDLTELFKPSEIDQNFDSYSKKELDEKDKQLKALFTALVGNGIDLAKIFDKKEDYKPLDENNYPKAGDFKYSNENFDEKLAEIESSITAEEFEILQSGKAVFEAIVLSGILTADTLSASMVEKYVAHFCQLQALKRFAHEIGDDFYKSLFADGGIYSNYVEGTGNPAKTTPREDFYKALSKALDELKDLTDTQTQFIDSVKSDIEFETYLPKQRQSDNGAIPYQIHEHELVKILENQGQYYPFLRETVTSEIEDEDGNVSQKDQYKIQALFKFRIPYYVGTLSTNPGWVRDSSGNLVKSDESPAKNAWLVRKSEEKLTPWNFDAVIDKNASAVNFIERMTNFDTYLPSEKVLPKNSLLYQEFTIYNELMISGYFDNGQKVYFDPATRQAIVNDLFKKHKKVSANQLIDFLESEGIAHFSSPRDLFGIDTYVKAPGFNTTYSTYLDLIKAGLTDEEITAHRAQLEQIIKWQTIFEDKKILKKTIKAQNWDFITPEILKKLANKHYTGWGRLSEKLLDGLHTSNGKTIIEELKTGKYDNFMRLLEDPEIAQQIKDAQLAEVDETKLNYGMVADLAGSPAIKKGIWQSLQVVAELEKVLGRENIAKIVVEMARGNQGGRTTTRQKQIEKFYEKFSEKTGEDVPSDIRDEFNAQPQHAFDSERLFLYFLQNGKCMYSGRDLDLDRLSDYEVDHIVPRTYIKDDSFDNKVLVLKSENQNKGGDVPSKAIIAKMRDYWELLAKAGQVSPRKLANLKRGSLSDDAKEGFIKRQLVETRQITKHVANLLAKYFESANTEILTPKAGLTHDFREGVVYIPAKEFDFEHAQQLNYAYDHKHVNQGEITDTTYNDSKFVKLYIHDGFPKNRDLNDYHHAHDAYLNAVVANYVYETRPDLKKMWIYGDYQRKSQREMGKHGAQHKDFFKQLLTDMKDERWLRYLYDEEAKKSYESGEFWKRDDVFETIEKTLNLRNVNIVKKTEHQIGKFGDETVYKADPTVKNYATGIKQHLDPNRYGGPKGPISAFAVVVRSTKGRNQVIKALSIPSMLGERYRKTSDKLAFVQALYPTEKVSAILVPEVDKYTKFENQGVVRLLSSYQEALKADALTLTMDEVRSLSQENSDLLPLFDKITAYLKRNQVYGDKHLTDWETNVREEFLAYDHATQAQFIKDAFTISHTGTTNAKGLVKGKIGIASGQQQHKSSAIDVITDGTTLIHQSITGLYETRRKL
jgi:CRISPR-associated endonuclease Csn1